MRTPEKDKIVELALGRIFRICSRLYQDGDVEEYERCRAMILDLTDAQSFADHVHNYARDRLKGASGS